MPDVGVEGWDGPSVAADREAELRGDVRAERVVAEVDRVRAGGRRGAGCGERRGSEAARHEQIVTEDGLLAVDLEVGKRAVDTGRSQLQRHGPAAVGAEPRVQVLIAGEVAADDDQMDLDAAVDVDIAYRGAMLVEDPEPEPGGLPPGERRSLRGERVASRPGCEAAGPALLGRARPFHRHVRSVQGRRLSSVTRRRAGQRGEHGDHEQPEREGDQPLGDTKMTNAGEHLYLLGVYRDQD